MADVNNKLRLEIVTQLDAAGIKATKEQVDALELGLRRAGKTGAESGQKFGLLEKALGNLPGPLGKIGGALGGLATQATMVVGAFSMGWEMGNKIVDMAKKWGMIADPIKDLVKENKAYDQALKNLKESLEAAATAEIKRGEAAAAAADRAIKRIDDETAAYIRQATSLERIKKATGNAEMMQLERSKFEDMSAYSNAGYAEAAEQIGRYYDVLEAELAAKQQLEAFDRESAKLARSQERDAEAYAKALDNAARAKQRIVDAEDRLEAYRREKTGGGALAYGNEADALKDDQLEKRLEAARKRSEEADRILAARAAKLDTVSADNAARAMERANLVAGGALGVDRAAQAYDSYVSQAGNPLGADIDPNWSNELLQKTIDAERGQRDQLEVTRRIEALLERALTGGGD